MSIISFNDSQISDMKNWSCDIPNGSRLIFHNILEMFRNKKAKILEIGSFTGTSLISMLYYLPDSIGTSIDIWNVHQDTNLDILLNNSNKTMGDIEQIYYNNLKEFNVEDRVRTLKGLSKDMLISLIKNNETFSFIYVDGSHAAFDVYMDLILSWELLDSNGIIGIDDYLWNDSSYTLQPKVAIDNFLQQYSGKYHLLDMGYRVFIMKI